MSSVQKIFLAIGIGFIVLALVWPFLTSILKLGRLPGDIAIEKENFKFYFPVTTSILLSVVLSLLLVLYNWFSKR